LNNRILKNTNFKFVIVVYKRRIIAEIHDINPNINYQNNFIKERIIEALAESKLYDE
jgi:hypothetical protein